MRLDVPIPQTSTRRAQTATRKAGRGPPHMSHHTCATTGLYSSTHHLENEFRQILGHPSSRRLHRHDLGLLSPAYRASHAFLSAVNFSFGSNAESISSSAPGPLSLTG